MPFFIAFHLVGPKPGDYSTPALPGNTRGQSVLAEQRSGGLEVLDGVNRSAVDADLEMQVRARRATGGSDLGDELALGHALAGADEEPRVVAVQRLQAVAM